MQPQRQTPSVLQGERRLDHDCHGREEKSRNGITKRETGRLELFLVELEEKSERKRLTLSLGVADFVPSAWNRGGKEDGIKL